MIVLIMVHFIVWPQPVETMDVFAAEEQAEPVRHADVQALPAPMVEDKPAVQPLTELPPLQPQGIVEAPQEPIDSHAVFASLAAGDRTGGLQREASYVTPSQPTVYLTFDDGPTKLTPEVLDILKKYDVPATFFVLGELADQQEDIIRRIHEEGHAIGNHTYNHKYEELYGDFTSFWEQVRRTDAILMDIIGEKPSILRAPGGTATNFDAFYFYYLECAGYKIHDWTIDSGDSKRRGVPAAEIVENVKKAKLTHEVTLLMHDGAGHQETVKALPEIIEYFRSKGYRFASIDESVKPVMFQVRNTKWDRAADEEQYKRMMAAITNAESGMVSDQVKVLSAEAAAPANAAWIGIRDWASERGTISWDPVMEKAIVEIEDVKVELYAATGKVMRYQAGAVPMVMNVQFTLENGRIYVLQSDLEQLVTHPRRVV